MRAGAAACVARERGRERGALLFEQIARQLEVLTLAWVRIEQLWATRGDTFHVGGVMRGKPRPFVQHPSMGEHVPAAGFIDVETDDLLADRTLRRQGVKPPPAKQLEELDDPYG